MNDQLDWRKAQCGVEVGLIFFLQHDADAYPRLHIAEAKDYQNMLYEQVKALAHCSDGDDGGMSVTPGAFDEHWQSKVWQRTAGHE